MFIFSGNPARRKFVVTGLIVLMVLSIASPLVAQPGNGSEEVTAVIGDLIKLSVPGHPEYELDLVVGTDGQVEIPEIGGINIAGLTKSEVETVLRQRLRLFDPTISAISLSMGRDGSITLYVIGGVVSPGEREFLRIPTIWELLRSVGGTTEDANLSGARIIRQIDGGTQIEPVDLTSIYSGMPNMAVSLQDGDTLVLPTLSSGLTGPVANGVHVFGGVEEPAVLSIDEPTPLLDILMMAGSPLESAELDKIWWVHPQGGVGLRSTRVSLKSFMEEGNPTGNPLIFPGDSVMVDYQKPGWLAGPLRNFLLVVASAGTIWLTYDRITE